MHRAPRMDSATDALRAAGADLCPVGLRRAEKAPDAIGVLLTGQAARIHANLIDDERLDSQIRDRLRPGRSFGELAASTCRAGRGPLAAGATRGFRTSRPATGRHNADAGAADRRHPHGRAQPPSQPSERSVVAGWHPHAADPRPAPAATLQTDVQLVAAPGWDLALLGHGHGPRLLTERHLRRAPGHEPNAPSAFHAS
jgi:hypothetical protein